MNAIALFLMLVLNGNTTCQMHQTQDHVDNGQTYKVEFYDCYWAAEDYYPSHRFEVWSPVCPTYVAQPILIRERTQRKGWTMNQFGEFYPASEDIDRMPVYRPRCE
jgi:hypothetical protein